MRHVTLPTSHWFKPNASVLPKRKSTKEWVVYTLSLSSAPRLSMPPTLFCVPLCCCCVACVVPFFWGNSCGKGKRHEALITAAAWLSQAKQDMFTPHCHTGKISLTNFSHWWVFIFFLSYEHTRQRILVPVGEKFYSKEMTYLLHEIYVYL